MGTVDMDLPDGHVLLSPHHMVELSSPYAMYVETPPDHDIVLHNISTKLANGEPLIQGELVLAGKDTRVAYELARTYPVHFRKTYYPTCFHQDPVGELNNLNRAAEILGIPPAIGCTRTSFRSCYIPGRPLNKLSPFGVEPDERNIDIAKEEANPSTLIGLWKLLQELYGKVQLLHANGLAHGDLFLHNAIVSLSPVEVCLIDFELAKQRDDSMNDATWAAICTEDLRELLREAVFVQCGLGTQRGPLASAARKALPELFGKNAGRFRRAMENAVGGGSLVGHKVRTRGDDEA